MITYEQGIYRFTYRVAGLFVHDQEALLHRPVSDDFWALPGGKGEFMESSEQTIKRELKEEMGVDVDVLRLLWVVEHFHENGKKKNHEIGLCYLLALPKDSSLLDMEEFTGNEGKLKLIFKWFSIEELENVKLYPSFLRVSIKNLPFHTEHLVHIDR